MLPLGREWLLKTRTQAGFLRFPKLRNCGEEGDRTLDLRIANAALSQLSYPPNVCSILYHSISHIKALSSLLPCFGTSSGQATLNETNS